MGTSGSSPGPGGGVPLVPRWVPDNPAPAPAPPPAPPPEQPEDGAPPPSPARPAGVPPGAPRIPMPAVPVPGPAPVVPTQVPAADLAPARRFGGTRHSLGDYARTGSREHLRRGLGRYVRDGLKGSAAGARRMGATASTAAGLHGAFSALAAGQLGAADLGVDPASLAGRPANEIMDVVIERIRPVDGTQDSEANRHAAALATSDLLVQVPDADLTALSPDQIDLLVEHYVANDLCQRIELDVGSRIETKAPDPATAVQRLEDMKGFVAAEVNAAFRAQRDKGQRLRRGVVANLVQKVIADVFKVFEEYLQ